MPFRVTDKLPENPQVKIFFSGQMIIQPNDDSTSCEVFVNRAALDHHVSIEVREKRFNGPDVIVMRYPGPLSFMPDDDDEFRNGLKILADNPKGLGMYDGPPQPGGEETLALAIDLAGGKFAHAKGVTIDEKGGTPSILLNDGLFYTAEKTPAALSVKLLKGETEVETLQPFANLIAANIYLEGEDKLSIRWREMGRPNVLELQRRVDGTSFEIYILNEPLYVDDESEETHDEFHEYYKILGPVPPEEQLKLAVSVPPGTIPPKGTPRTLCMSLILNR